MTLLFGRLAHEKAERERLIRAAEVWLSHLYDFRDSMREELTANPQSDVYALQLENVTGLILEFETLVAETLVAETLKTRS